MENNSNTEIERKFLTTFSNRGTDHILNTFNINTDSIKVIEQGYLSTDKECELRIRKTSSLNEKVVQYELTYKSIHGIDIPIEEIPVEAELHNLPLLNKEVTIRLTKSAYNEIRGKIESDLMLNKTRHVIPWENDLEIELDVYSGRLQGLIVAEVEFKSLEDSYLFNHPFWFGKEVTDDERYKNRNLLKLCTKVIRSVEDARYKS